MEKNEANWAILGVKTARVDYSLFDLIWLPLAWSTAAYVSGLYMGRGGSDVMSGAVLIWGLSSASGLLGCS